MALDKVKARIEKIGTPEERAQQWIELLKPLFELEQEWLLNAMKDVKDVSFFSDQEVLEHYEYIKQRGKDSEIAMNKYVSLFQNFINQLLIPSREYGYYQHNLMDIVKRIDKSKV